MVIENVSGFWKPMLLTVFLIQIYILGKFSVFALMLVLSIASISVVFAVSMTHCT